MKKNKAIFPGTFEIFHEGHILVLQKALKLFDYIYLVVSNNEEKSSSSLEIRYNQAKNKVKELKIKNVKVLKNEKLTIDIANELNTYYIIRGVRDGYDLAYEINLFNLYKSASDKIEIVLFVTDDKYKNISSTKLLKEKKEKK